MIRPFQFAFLLTYMTAFRDGSRTEERKKDPARSASSWFPACLMFSGKDEGFGAREALDPALKSCVTLGKSLPLSGAQGPIYKKEKHNVCSIMLYSKGIL